VRKPPLRKALGQHHLVSGALTRPLVDFLAPRENRVLEIGPGGGILTAELLAAGARRLIGWELDPDWAAVLRRRLPDPRLTLVVGDALEIAWNRLLAPTLMAGNLPYNVATAIIEDLLPHHARIPRAAFLVQKEVAERVRAEPGGRTYGALTVGVQAVARAERLFVVPAGAFHPRPTVDSAVLRLIPFEPPLVAAPELPRFRRLVVGIFGFRRKQLGRGIRELTGWTPGRVGEVLTAAGVDPSARPETLPPPGFVRLLRALVDGGWAGK